MKRSNVTSYKLNSENIVPLIKLLPLAVPFAVWLELTNFCNFECNFCPTGDKELLKKIGRPSGFISYELFEKIIKDLYNLTRKSGKKIERLHLYKDGESLLHKDIGKIISYVKEKDICNSLELTTNGSLMTADKSEILVKNGLDGIRISVEHVNDKKYKEITSTFSNYKTIVKNVSQLFNEREKAGSSLKIYVKIIDTGLTEKEKKKFYNDFSAISDYIYIDKLMTWTGTGIKRSNFKSKRKVCSEPFTKLSINFNGTVSLCCVDWSHGSIVGDINKQSIEEIWNGEKIRQFRQLHIEGRKDEIEICQNCDYINNLPKYTNIDDYTDLLRKIYLS